MTQTIPPDDAALPPLLDRLRSLFAEMDRAWDRSADAAGFTCEGCADNCCRARFYHHTWAEFMLLREAFRALPPEEKAAALRKAEAVSRTQEAGDRVMCPLNVEGRCRVYAGRPMICRLHGIPSAFRRPDGTAVHSPGCEDYHRRVPESAAVPMDRTRHYRALARLEGELKSALGRRDRIRMTVAEMVVAFGREGE
ncbi:MAG: YkgJ family cysteine cluster protein [Desulfococcaceae bacterium]